MEQHDIIAMMDEYINHGLDLKTFKDAFIEKSPYIYKIQCNRCNSNVFVFWKDSQWIVDCFNCGEFSISHADLFQHQGGRYT